MEFKIKYAAFVVTKTRLLQENEIRTVFTKIRGRTLAMAGTLRLDLTIWQRHDGSVASCCDGIEIFHPFNCCILVWIGFHCLVFNEHNGNQPLIFRHSRWHTMKINWPKFSSRLCACEYVSVSVKVCLEILHKLSNKFTIWKQHFYNGVFVCVCVSGKIALLYSLVMCIEICKLS